MTTHRLEGGSKLTRRRLVLSGAAAVAGLYVTGTVPAAAWARGPAYLRRASYAALTGGAFPAIGSDGAAVTLRLSAVSDLVRAAQTPSLAGRDDAFTLTFSGPSETLLAGGTRKLRHPSLGWVSLFITPVGAATRGQLYEVVVDRAAPPSAPRRRRRVR